MIRLNRLHSRAHVGMKSGSATRENAIINVRATCVHTRARTCTDPVGGIITIRSAYKGMHQGGNKSGARGPSICFHLHGRDAKMEKEEGDRVRAQGGEQIEARSSPKICKSSCTICGDTIIEKSCVRRSVCFFTRTQKKKKKKKTTPTPSTVRCCFTSADRAPFKRRGARDFFVRLDLFSLGEIKGKYARISIGFYYRLNSLSPPNGAGFIEPTARNQRGSHEIYSTLKVLCK